MMKKDEIMDKRLLASIASLCGAIGLISIGIFYYIFHNVAMASMPTSTGIQPYFSYSTTDIQSLDSLNSDKVITKSEIDHWVQVVFDLVKKNHKKIDSTRIYAYLFTAQRDAAALSYKAKKKLSGNLTAVSTKTLCLLLPDECGLIPQLEESDTYSLKIAEIVTKKVNERLAQEEKALDSLPASSPPQEWAQDKSYFGRNFGHEIPWLINAGNQFRLKNPKAYSAKEIQLQKEELKNILSSITKEQIEAAHKWAGGAGTISTSGQWLELANTYMTKRQIPLERALAIRSILAMGVADATIAYFDSKYTYWKQRPEMLFPDLKPTVKTPDHPSYPSGHATIAMAAVIIMDHYFPENQTQWDKTAYEIGQSRLWGGVHFPVDDYHGQELGRKIGDWVVSKIKNK